MLTRCRRPANREISRPPHCRLVHGQLIAEFTHEDLVNAVGDVNVELAPALDPAGPEPPVSEV